MASLSNNTTIKILGVPTGGYVVPAGHYVEADYTYASGTNDLGFEGNFFVDGVIKRTFGPGQTVPASVTLRGVRFNANSTGVALTATLTYNLSSGIVYQNTPL